ncbi:TetR/AcrR family transcriptional regulator [Flavobacteriaceae bacterium MJ-SS4]|uniref:TetR/AcrR family transcriptional regulator n=1 Tax=Gilvirhabdus luticola TaxID=3079858 RepID=UPI0032DCCDAF
MKMLLSNLKIDVPNSIYNKDPQSSNLGKRIITGSINLIEEIGFESFTFKKLGSAIDSNESSIYRYFESKYKLLIYLTSWYWAWLEYKFVFEIHNIHDPELKLRKGIEVVTRTIKEDSNFSHIDEVKLNKIIINESSKSFLNKEVDQENKEGHFEIYKRLVKRLSDLILNVNNEYKASLSLASTIIESALHQHFLKEHLMSITNCNKTYSPTQFLLDLTLKTIRK